MAQLDDKRKGEIAYLVLLAMLKEQGFDLDQNFRRRVGNLSKRTKVSFAEMLEFKSIIVGELLADVSDGQTPPTEEEIAGDDERDNRHYRRGGGH